MSAKERICELVEAKKDSFITVSDKVWEFAEIGMREHKSAAVIIECLKSEGFEVESGLAGIPTAFCATYGSGKPIIGFLGEYDALPNLSQKASCSKKEAVTEGGNGHGCGHNLLGAGALAGAVAFKDYLIENNLSGTVKYFGCPGEEFGCGKAFMARDGHFNDLNCALTWHPGDSNAVWAGSCLANASVYFSFAGQTAHAAAIPHLGRSALDAAELMNVGVNFLREHVIQEARIHYAFNDAGGEAPNVVQDRAKLHYYIRAPKREQVSEIFERIVKVANGAAMMTETQCTVKFKDGLSEYIPNLVVSKAISDAMLEVGPISFDDADFELAKSFGDSLPPSAAAAVRTRGVLATGIDSYAPSTSVMPGSTDVGDVSYVTPTGQFTAASYCVGSPPHAWQTTAFSSSSVGHKSVLFAGKVLALTAVRLLQEPQLLVEAREEFMAATGGKKYTPIFPDDTMPTL